jgi:transcriptional regulator with GAF, ATPase, and Fis domain
MTRDEESGMTRDGTVTVRESTLLPGARLAECVLEVIEGPDRGRRFLLGPGRLELGASRRCDVTLSDPTVSSRHARLTLLADGIALEDLDSKNGTRYLGSRVRSIVVQAGATFELGTSRLVILPPETAAGPPPTRTSYGELIGTSLAWRRVFGTLERLERCEATVLLQGETGVGKSAVAREIHAHSPRAARPMATLDCGAVPSTLLASELFGHARGAFTGAVKDRAGIVQGADGSTLLLEEIGDLPLELQPMLLRLLESREYQRVGEAHTRRIDVRIIAATHLDLQAAVAGGSFRQDLYYRLGVIAVRIPPLRECREDIVPLAIRFLEGLGTAPAALTAGQRVLLETYDWPGNARQLRNAVERLAVTGDLFGPGGHPANPAAPPPRWEGDFHANKAEVVRQFEHDYLVAQLTDCQGNLSAAARQSGLARNHLRDLLRRHAIDVDRFRRGS